MTTPSLAEAARALANAVDTLNVGIYPAHGSGFVVIVTSGDVNAVKKANDALHAALDAQPKPIPPEVFSEVFDRAVGPSVHLTPGEQSVMRRALRRSGKLKPESEVMPHSGPAVQDRPEGHTHDNAVAPSVAGRAAPLSKADARRLANARHAYSFEDVPWIIGLIDSANARIAELERERDAARDTATRNAAVLKERTQERDALQAKLAERDPEKLIAEIERHAWRTKMAVWHGQYQQSACIYITRDALREALGAK